MPDRDKEPEIEKVDPTSVEEQKDAAKKKRVAALDDEDDISAKAGYQYIRQRDLNLLRTNMVVHPTVLLSIADHLVRNNTATNKRVVGIVLGENQGDGLHMTNTFGVPFEEDAKDKKVWYLDHCYLEKMFLMFKKINARERIVGWYSTAATIRENDIDIHEIVRRYCEDPIYLLTDARVYHENDSKFSVQTYYSFEQPSKDDQTRRTFVHVPCMMGSTEAEEVGVEHLLKDYAVSSGSGNLSTRINDHIQVLQEFSDKLADISLYLKDVADGKRPPRPHILTQLQRLLNLLPNKADPIDFAAHFQAAQNDSALTAYVAYATRLVLAIHALVKNKMKVREQNADATKAPPAAK